MAYVQRRPSSARLGRRLVGISALLPIGVHRRYPVVVGHPGRDRRIRIGRAGGHGRMEGIRAAICGRPVDLVLRNHRRGRLGPHMKKRLFARVPAVGKWHRKNSVTVRAALVGSRAAEIAVVSDACSVGAQVPGGALMITLSAVDAVVA